MSNRHFPNFIEAYVDYTRNQEATEKIHRWVAISIIAAALERKVVLDRGYYKLFPNLYTFIVGASGIVRKSTSTGIGVDLLRCLDHFNIMSERVTAASLIEQLQRSGSTFMVGNKEMRQSATFCYASELQVFLGEVFGSLPELLTTFYDCQPNDATKPWVYETKGSGQTKIYGPCLNILGASTPTWLTRAIPASEMEGGFSSRVIFVVENAPPSKFVAWPAVAEGGAAVREKLMQDLQRIHTLTGDYIVSDAARKWFEDWYQAHQTSLMKAQKDARFSGYFGRKGDTILKIAMLLCVAESDDLTLYERHLSLADVMLTELEQSMFDAFGSAGKNENAEDLKQVWGMLQANGTMKHSDLLKVLWRNIDHKKLMTITEDLRRMNLITATLEGDKLIYRTLDRAAKL